MNYYEILHVDPTASNDKIYSASKNVLRAVRESGKSKAERADMEAEIQSIVDTLTHSKTRHAYDQTIGLNSQADFSINGNDLSLVRRDNNEVLDLVRNDHTPLLGVPSRNDQRTRGHDALSVMNSMLTPFGNMFNSNSMFEEFPPDMMNAMSSNEPLRAGSFTSMSYRRTGNSEEMGTFIRGDLSTGSRDVKHFHRKPK
jgi:hypothetical protein